MPHRLVISLLTAAILALGGWVLKVDRAVASQEAKNDAIMQTLSAIQVDVREIRQWLMERR